MVLGGGGRRESGAGDSDADAAAAALPRPALRATGPHKATPPPHVRRTERRARAAAAPGVPWAQTTAAPPPSLASPPPVVSHADAPAGTAAARRGGARGVRGGGPAVCGDVEVAAVLDAEKQVARLHHPPVLPLHVLSESLSASTTPHNSRSTSCPPQRPPLSRITAIPPPSPVFQRLGPVRRKRRHHRRHNRRHNRRHHRRHRRHNRCNNRPPANGQGGPGRQRAHRLGPPPARRAAATSIFHHAHGPSLLATRDTPLARYTLAPAP